MDIIRTTKEMTEITGQLKQRDVPVGFVPTMGALHDGHLSLIRRSIADNPVTVVSIFVNPVQFNNRDDLQKYPRQLDADLALLKAEQVDYVFVPTETEIYPDGVPQRQYDLQGLDMVLEGAFRPNHFQGVALVVHRLFEIVQPQKAYFGEKDFQQLKIIQLLVKQLGLPITIVPVPIVREPDGLAMSSRNLRLSNEHRQAAPLIYKVLSDSKKYFNEYTIEALKAFVVDSINKHPLLEVEYFEIIDADTLQPVYATNEATNCLGVIAVYAGEIRLIDNICYTK